MPDSMIPPLPQLVYCEIRHIPHWPGYAVTDTGEVWGCRNNNNVSPYKDIWSKLCPNHQKDGYLGVTLVNNRHKKYKSISSLVLETFLETRPLKHEAGHHDNIRTNNHLSNLRWVTKLENAADRFRHHHGRYMSQRLEKCELTLPEKIDYASQLPVFDGCEIRHTPTFPGYAVTTTAEIWSTRLRKAWTQLKTVIGKKGRLTVTIRKDGRYRTVGVYHLMLDAFVCPCPPGQEARHLDDDKSNNMLANLAWGTHAENMYDIHRNGIRYNIGERNGNAKLKTCEVEEIKRLLLLQVPRKIIAQMFLIDRSILSRIVSKLVWKHL
jgi:hypothetical protein